VQLNAHSWETFLGPGCTIEIAKFDYRAVEIGTANQRRPFSPAAILLSTNQEIEKRNIKWQNKEL
jgi:hypothetical protein